MCQGLSEPDLMIRESWSSAFYMGKLPEKYILLTEGLQVLSFYSSVIVLVNESGYQYGICLNVGSCYSMTKYVQAGSKADGQLHFASCLILFCTFLQSWGVLQSTYLFRLSHSSSSMVKHLCYT